MDVRTAPALRRALDEAVAAAHGDLVVDLSGITFVDSAFLGALLGCYRRMPEGRRMVLRGPRPHVRALLQLAGVPSLMRVEDAPEGSAGHGA